MSGREGTLRERIYTAAAVRAACACVCVCLFACLLACWLAACVCLCVCACAKGTSEKLSKLHGAAQRQLHSRAATAAAVRRVEVSKQISQCCGSYMLVSGCHVCVHLSACMRACARGERASVRVCVYVCVTQYK